MREQIVLKTEHLVDARALARCPIPVGFGVVDREDLGFRWLDARRPDAIRVLLASSTIFPFVREAVAIDGTPFIDGGYRETVCYRRLRREHPDAALLLVLNDDEGDEPLLRRVAVGALLRLRDARLAEVWHDTIDGMPRELGEALDAPRTLVLKPAHGVPVHFATTDPAMLARGFWLGYQAVLKQRERLVRFLEGAAAGGPVDGERPGTPAPKAAVGGCQGSEWERGATRS